METTQHTHRTQARRLVTGLATTALAVGLAALPAAARQDAGEVGTTDHDPTFCAIQRVDTQFVGCDNLTGNGVPAPAWVDER